MIHPELQADQATSRRWWNPQGLCQGTLPSCPIPWRSHPLLALSLLEYLFSTGHLDNFYSLPCGQLVHGMVSSRNFPTQPSCSCSLPDKANDSLHRVPCLLPSTFFYDSIKHKIRCLQSGFWNKQKCLGESANLFTFWIAAWLPVATECIFDKLTEKLNFKIHNHTCFSLIENSSIVLFIHFMNVLSPLCKNVLSPLIYIKLKWEGEKVHASTITQYLLFCKQNIFL